MARTPWRDLIAQRVEEMYGPRPKGKQVPASSKAGDIDAYLKRSGYRGWTRKEESR